MFCDKKYHILTFCDRKYRNLTFCDKTENTVVQQNNAEASLSHSLSISSNFLLFPLISSSLEPGSQVPPINVTLPKPINTMKCILKVDMIIKFSIHVICTIQHNTIPSNTMQFHTTPYNTVQQNTKQYNFMQCKIKPYIIYSQIT